MTMLSFVIGLHPFSGFDGLSFVAVSFVSALSSLLIVVIIRAPPFVLSLLLALQLGLLVVWSQLVPMVVLSVCFVVFLAVCLVSSDATVTGAPSGCSGVDLCASASSHLCNSQEVPVYWRSGTG